MQVYLPRMIKHIFVSFEMGVVLELERQRGRVVRAPDLKSGDSEFKSRSDHLRDLFEVVPGSTPWLRLYKANWSASCQLGFLTELLSSF